MICHIMCQNEIIVLCVICLVIGLIIGVFLDSILSFIKTGVDG